MSKKKVVKEPKKKVVKEPKKEIVKETLDDKVFDLIKSLCVDDRRFTINTVYSNCLQNSVLKNFHDLEDIFLSLEKKKSIYNVGGASWILPKVRRVRK